MSTPAEPPATDPAFLAKEEDFTKLPPELSHIDWTKPISWGKHKPYPPSQHHGNNTTKNAQNDVRDKQPPTSCSLAMISLCFCVRVKKRVRMRVRIFLSI